MEDKDNSGNDGEIVEIDYDKLPKMEQYEVLEGKFNVITSFQLKAYDGSKFRPEEKIVIKNEKDEEEVKNIPIANYIRWRYSKNDNESLPILDSTLGFSKEKKQIETNAKIVEWSDGTFQFVIGDEYFDIMFSGMDNVRYGLVLNDGNEVLVNKPIKQRMLLTPSEYSAKRTEKASEVNESSTKVKLTYSFYDKMEYRKEDFSSKYSNRRRQSNPNRDNKTLAKKRKRSGSNF